jgi:hypothetical protein
VQRRCLGIHDPDLIGTGHAQGFPRLLSATTHGCSAPITGSATRGGGEGGLDSNGALTIGGGTLISSGISATTSTLPGSGQGWVSITFGANQPAGTIVHPATTSGTPVSTVTAGVR